MRKWLIAAALAAAAASVLAACGGGDDEGEVQIQTTGNSTDRAFVAGMVPHHEAAIEMAKVAQEQGQSEFVTSLADDIVRTQQQEIDQMQAIDDGLAEAGVKAGDLGLSESMMGMSGQMSDLENAKSFDTTFMQMMVPHHQGAIQMAKIELQKGENPELEQLAQQIIDAQSREIKEMNAQLAGATGEQSMPEQGGSMDDMQGSGDSMDDMGM
jgi:uncharacterized protein (DUF305 family)